MDPDLRALDAHPLLTRLLRPAFEPDATVRIGGRTLPAPIVPPLSGPERAGAWPLSRIDLTRLPQTPDPELAAKLVVRLPVDSMATLMEAVRRLAASEPAAVLLDLTPLADVAPFGDGEWRPREREELAELRAAAGRPLWIDGIASAADAETAAEAGVDAVVVRAAVARRLGGVAVAELLPEVLDAVAGTVAVHVGGALRDGVDLFRYLAIGAELVLPDPGPDPARLREELRYAMRLTGCATVEDIGYESLFAPLWEDAP